LGLEAALGALCLVFSAGQSRRFSRRSEPLKGNYNGWLLAQFSLYRWPEGELATNVGFTDLDVGLLVLAVACFVRCRAYLGARSGGLTHWEGLAMGSGMNARARWRYRCDHRSLVGVLNQQMYSIIVMVAIVTS